MISLLLTLLSTLACVNAVTPLDKRIASDQSRSTPRLKSNLISVTQTQFDTFVRYVQFSSAAYASTCKTPPNGATLIENFSNSGTDTHGFIAQDPTTHEIIVAFRGTDDVQTLATDFNQTLVTFNSVGINCAACMVFTLLKDLTQVHGGYVNQWNSVSEGVISTVQGLLKTTPGAPVTVTGHSLGASLASLASMSMSGVGISLTTYTFGQPRTGNQAYADFVDSVLPLGKMFRVTHSNDGVPQTIPTSQGYRHHSTEFWQNDPVNVANVVQCTGQEPAVSNPPIV